MKFILIFYILGGDPVALGHYESNKACMSDAVRLSQLAEDRGLDSLVLCAKDHSKRSL